MLSSDQIRQLSVRVTALRAELQDSLDYYCIDNENMIDQELEEALLVENPIDNQLEMIEGLTNAQRIKNLIQLIEEWIATKQVDKQKHRNHQELLQVGLIFSPRNQTIQTPQPMDPSQMYRLKVKHEVEETLQSAMLDLYEMGYQQYNWNLEMIYKAAGQVQSQQELLDYALDIIDKPSPILQTPKFPQESREEVKRGDVPLLVTKNLPDEQIPEVGVIVPNKKVITPGEQESKDLMTLQVFKEKIVIQRKTTFSPQDSQMTELERQFVTILNQLTQFKENLLKQLKFKREPSEQELANTIAFFENQEGDDLHEEKIRIYKLYKDLIRDLPLYQQFISDKPVYVFDTIEQVKEILDTLILLEDQLNFLNELLLHKDEEKQILYYEGLNYIKGLAQTEQYQMMKSDLDDLAKQGDWNKMNMQLISSFMNKDPKLIIMKHASIKYFQQLCYIQINKNHLLENPVSIKIITKALEEAIITENNQQEKDVMLELFKQFKEGNIDEAMKISYRINNQDQLNRIYQDNNLRHIITWNSHSKETILDQLESLNLPQEFKESYFFKDLTSVIASSNERTVIEGCYIDLHNKRDPEFKISNLHSLLKISAILNEKLQIYLKPYEYVVQLTNDLSVLKIVKEILDNISPQTGFMNQVRQMEETEADLNSFFETLYENHPQFFSVFAKFLEQYPGIDYGKVKKIVNEQSFESKLQKAIQWSEQVIFFEKECQYQVSDFMTIDISNDIGKLTAKICKDFKDTQKIERDELVHLLFELIKKRLNFEDFLQQLYEDLYTTDVQITQMNLLRYLLDQCSSELCTMLILACSKYMPVLLIAYRPVKSPERNENLIDYEYDEYDENNKDDFDQIPNYQQALENQDTIIPYRQMVYKELLFTYENYKGVLAFKVNTNKNRFLKGCTTMTNRIMNRQFETHSSQSPLANFGQVEIQFDYNFVDTKFIPVADVHGYLEGEQLKTLMSQFSIFIIHCYTDDADAVRQIIEQLDPSSLIIIVQQDEATKKPFLKETNSSNSINSVIEYKINLFDIFEREKMLYTQLTKKIYEMIREYTKNWNKYEQNVQSRIQTLEKFARFCLSFNDIKQDQSLSLNKQIPRSTQIFSNSLAMNQQHLQRGFGYNSSFQQIPSQEKEADQVKLVDTVITIKNFMDMIIANEEILKSEKILPMNYIYSMICESEKKIQRNQSLNQETIENYRKSNEEKILNIAKKEQGIITKRIQVILCSQDSYVGVVSVLAKLIKSVVNSKLDPLFLQRSELQKKLSQKEIQTIENNEGNKSIANINIQIEKLQFSIEFLFREYHIQERIFEGLKQNDPQSMQINQKSYETFIQFAEYQIRNGQPFEIIDGDNMKFISGVYQQLQKDFESDDEILVISVIGPQSSGKSLLLNTLFGAQFQSSAGRCTKGVYGCLIDINQQDQISRFKKILILDTEGIQSSEKKDTGFDNRIVFYILCISHIVLVCNKGEMNAQMQQMLQIAVYSISEFKSLVTNMPHVNIIMNMIPQVDERNLDQTYQALSNSLREMGKEKNDSHLILNIQKENVFMLPLAFSHQGEFNDLQINTPSKLFAKSVEKLNQNLFKFMTDGKQKSMKHSLSSFFEFAAKTWETINNLHEIDKFSSVKQKEQGMEVQQFISKIIKQQFQTQKEEIKIEVDKIADHELKKYNETYQITNSQLQLIIQPKLIEYMAKINEDLNHLYQEFCKNKGIENVISMMYQDSLQRMITTNQIEWNNVIKAKISKFFEVKSNMRGNKHLQDIVEKELAKFKGKIDEKTSNQIFKDNWKKMLEERQKELKSVEKITEEVFDDVCHFYKNQVKSFRSHVEDFELLKSFINQSYHDNSLIKNLETKHQTDFLFFTGNKKAPEPDKFQERYDKIGAYVQKMTYYKLVQSRDLYNWQRLIKERFDFKKLSKNLTKQLLSKQNKFYQGIKMIITFKNPQEIVQDIINQITQEGQKFQIGITEEFINSLNQIRQYFELLKVNKKDSLKQFTNQQVQEMKDNLDLYFQYIKCPYSYKRQENSHQYFQPINFSMNNYIEKEQLDPGNTHFQEIKQGFVELSSSKLNLVANTEILYNSESNQVNLSIQNYLNQIQIRDSFNLQSNENAVVNARNFFFRKLDKNRIISEIQQVVIENIYRIKDDCKNIKIYQDLIQTLQMSKDANITSQFCQLDTHLFQRICSQVQTIICKIDTELETFYLNVSDYGNFALHQITQILISAIYIELRRLNEYSPLFNLQKTEETEMKIFVAKLTSKDDDRDKSLAERAANLMFKKIIHQQAREEQINAFNQHILKLDGFFNVQNIIQEIEDYLVRVANEFENGNCQDEYLKDLLDNKEIFEERKSNDIIEQPGLKDRRITWEQIILMYVKPKDFFDQCFAQSWQQKVQPEIEILQKKYADQIQKMTKNLIDYFQKFRKLVKNKKLNYAINIFIPETHNSEGGKEEGDQLYQQTCNKAFSHYLRQVLLMQWDPKEPIKIGDLNVKLDNNHLLIHQDDLDKYTIPMDQRISLASSLENEMLSNVEIFVEEIIKCFQNEKSLDSLLDQSDLISDSQHLMRQRTTGCNQLCPLCRRKCDLIHQEREDQKIHCSSTGHQLIGFGGSFHAKNDYAITYGCHQLEDQDLVIYEGVSKPWIIYKQQFSHKWNFQSTLNDEDGIEHKNNNNKIWNLIGPIICRYYQKNISGCRIKFTIADDNAKRMGQVENIMYILALDSSGSMEGKKWNDVLGEAKRFLETLSNDHIVKSHTKISIISYADKAILNCENKEPEPKLVDSVKFIGNGTDFNNPLFMVEEIANRHLDKFNVFHVCFLSDGQASFPSKAIKSIKENKILYAKFKITTVAFGKDLAAVGQINGILEVLRLTFMTRGRGLKQIAEQFENKGSYKEALHAEDFKNVLTEMIPVVYRDPNE